MANVVAIVNDSITFSLYVNRPNDLPMKLGLKSLISKYGLILPLEVTFATILDYCEGTVDWAAQKECSTVGLLLTPEGRLYEFRIPAPEESKAQPMIRRRWLYGEGSSSVRASAGRLEESMLMAVHITKSLEEANELLRKVCPLAYTPMEVYKIDELLKMIHEAGFTTDVPLRPERPNRRMRVGDNGERFLDGFPEPMTASRD